MTIATAGTPNSTSTSTALRFGGCQAWVNRPEFRRGLRSFPGRKAVPTGPSSACAAVVLAVARRPAPRLWADLQCRCTASTGPGWRRWRAPTPAPASTQRRASVGVTTNSGARRQTGLTSMLASCHPWRVRCDCKRYTAPSWNSGRPASRTNVATRLARTAARSPSRSTRTFVIR
jgi:hypothetical protein